MPIMMIRIFKSWQARDDQRRWVNTYEISGPSASPIAYEGVVSTITAAEKVLHLAPVQFLSATVSTWVADGEPYNPESFVSMALTGTGGRALGADPIRPLDANICLHIQRTAATGRMGKLFYRGCLFNTDVVLGSDASFQLVTGSVVDNGGAIFNSYQNLMNTLLNISVEEPNMVMAATYDGGPLVSRNVLGLSVAGVTINRRNHRYFDRALG